MPNALVAFVVALAVGLQAEPADERIYGRVLTADGERLEGWLRWDRNETSWIDFLDARKPIPRAYDREAEELDPELHARRQRERSLSLPGLRITWDEDDGEPRTTASAVRFGHVRSLEVVDEETARLVLVSGEEIDLMARSSDLGRALRGLVVEDVARGTVELRWRELQRVELMAGPPGSPPPVSQRLRGTLTTSSGVELRGYVAWDLDESLASDVLDGRQGGRSYEIPFGDIASIRRESSNAARVTLRSGEQLVLRGTNDVNAQNRGIEISDPSLGRATVGWDAFASLRLEDDGASPVDRETGRGSTRVAFDGGRPLLGTVETRGGERIGGRIRWNNDHERTWEVLEGRSGGVEYGVELGLVRSIERLGAGGARVELRDGRVLELDGSSDVSEENEGIFVRPDGEATVLVRWRDLTRVTFAP